VNVCHCGYITKLGEFLLNNSLIKKKPALAPSQNLLKEPLDWMVA
jgi:hypothetical protein